MNSNDKLVTKITLLGSNFLSFRVRTAGEEFLIRPRNSNLIQFVLVGLAGEIYSELYGIADIFIALKTLTVTNMIPALTWRPFYQDISFLDLRLSRIIPHESRTIL